MSIWSAIALLLLILFAAFIVFAPWLSLLDIGTIAKELTAIRRLMEEKKL